MSEHQYQGGQIISMDGSPVRDHYHVSYTHGPEGAEGTYEDGFTVNVEADGFSATDEWEEGSPEHKFPTLAAAVEFCFSWYSQIHPGEEIRPVWGAGAPNDTLRELGYTPSLVPDKKADA